MEPYSQQLTTVRERLGMSQKEVAHRLGISPSLVSKWEKGERKPDDSQFWELGRLFGVTASFLQKRGQAVDFRPRTQMARNSSEKEAFGSALNDAAQQIEFLHTVWEMAQRTPRRLPLMMDYADSQIIELADSVRKFFQLNDKVSYSELRNALAEKDVQVFEWKLPAKLSGLSFQKDFSVIFINESMPERVKLFTLCHELAHLLFHLRGENQTEVSVMASRNDPHEREANRFAAELLMPTPKIQKLVSAQGNRLRELATFSAAVELFGVSPAALFYRLAQSPWTVMHYTMKGELITETSRSSEVYVGSRIPGTTTELNQVAPEFLKLALDLWIKQKATSGMIAEWCFTSRSKMDSFLLNLLEPKEDWDLGLGEVDDLVR